MPFLGFRVNSVLDAATLRSPEGRARAAEQALAVIAEHPSELVRDQYVMQVADRCRLDPDQLRARLRAPRAVRVVADRPFVRATRVWLPDSPEVNALLALIHAPDAVDDVLMQDLALTESMFTDLKNLAAFRALASTASIEAAIAAADPGAADLLLQLSVADFDGDPEDAVASLVRAAARRAIATSTNPIDPEVHKALLDVSEPVSRPAAIAQLLTWLCSRSEDSRA